MTPLHWTLIWVLLFIFGPIFIIPVKFGSYLGGTIMGAVLMIGLAVMDGGQK